jgi:hypothetical protein
MRYDIPEHVKQNILTFLSRTDLKGSEVSAYVEILNVLNKPVVVEGENADR